MGHYTNWINEEGWTTCYSFMKIFILCHRPPKRNCFIDTPTLSGLLIYVCITPIPSGVLLCAISSMLNESIYQVWNISNTASWDYMQLRKRKMWNGWSWPQWTLWIINKGKSQLRSVSSDGCSLTDSLSVCSGAPFCFLLLINPRCACGFVCVCVSITTLAEASFIYTLELRYKQLYYIITLIFNGWIL